MTDKKLRRRWTNSPAWPWMKALTLRHWRDLDPDGDPAVLLAWEYWKGTLRHRIHDAVETARKIWTPDGWQRWEMEARMLAGQSDFETAAAMKVSACVVWAYRKVFFEVEDRDEDWIARYALRLHCRNHRGMAYTGAAIRFLGVSCGAEAVDYVCRHRYRDPIAASLLTLTRHDLGSAAVDGPVVFSDVYGPLVPVLGEGREVVWRVGEHTNIIWALVADIEEQYVYAETGACA